MAFDWSGYLDLAVELADRTGNEAAERAAISRAYYAVFGSARRWQARHGATVPQSARAHLMMWEQFHAVPDSTHRRIADLGRRLLRYRRRADYDDIYLDLSRDTRQSVTMARQLLTDLKQLR